MTAQEIFDLRTKGEIERAYEAARQLYAVDKSPYVTSAMFWTAVDALHARANVGQTDDAEKILKALERLLPTMSDKNGWGHEAFEKCQTHVRKAQGWKDHSKNRAEHQHVGNWGEELAAVYLREKGYVILEHDWRSGHRDIDLIARNSEYLVFVEVKTRRNTDYGDPAEAVNYKKRENLRRTMNHYIRSHKVDTPVRFDIITIVGTIGCTSPIITHLEDVPLYNKI